MADHTMEELLQLVQASKFHGRENDNPHTHISNFKRMTATLKYRDVPNDVIKLMLFLYSLEDRARIWGVVSKTDDRIDKLADQISNLVDIVNKQVIPPAKAVEKTCVTCGGAHAYYDSSGNLLSKTTREALKIIENNSKVRYSRSKSNVSRVNTNSRDSSNKTDDRIDKLADQILNLVEIVNKQVITPATAKAVEETCVICGGA
nr:hypothetical protein [Tanacetum cinerariifolium]